VKDSSNGYFEVGAVNRPPPTPKGSWPLRNSKNFIDIQSLSSLLSP
jgi:hypothetical protein